MSHVDARPRVGVVVLTQGKRPDDLQTTIASALAQTGVDLDIVVVGNGWQPENLPPGVRSRALPENQGIPAGRNRGAEVVTGEYLLFLDDDASIPSPTFTTDAIALMQADRQIGLVQPRAVDPSGAANPTRWVPRLDTSDPTASSHVFSVWEGVLVADRATFESFGGWGDPYFYAHEGIELAWRVWAAGRSVWYAGDLIAHHPAIDPRRHREYFRLNARNRVWLAKRNLPWLLVPFYVASWTLVQLLRSIREPATLVPWFGGWLEGWRTDPGGRRSMGWRGVWRMTRAGRLPIL